MYCRKCGKEVQDGDVFCFSCGQKINDMTAGETTGIEDGVKTSAETKTEVGNVLKDYFGLNPGAMGRLIIYTILAIACWHFSGLALFDIFGYEFSLGEILDMLIDVLSLSNEFVLVKLICQICLWLYKIGVFVYFGAIIFVFKKNMSATKKCVVAGFICNAVVVCAVVISVVVGSDALASVLYMEESNVISFIMNYVSENFYIYIALNVTLLVCGSKLSENAQKTRSAYGDALAEIAAEETVKSGDWRCEKCGERNGSHMNICRACSTSRKKTMIVPMNKDF